MISRYREPDVRTVRAPHLEIKRGVSVRVINGPHQGVFGVGLAVRKDRSKALIESAGIVAGKHQRWIPLADFEAIRWINTNLRRKREAPRSAPKHRR